MLPRALAEGVASLHQGVDRCALSAMFEIDAHTNEIVNVWYGRTAIHNKWALTYAEAQAIVDGRHGELAPDRKAAVSLRYLFLFNTFT
jgi:exoribonuclease R